MTCVISAVLELSKKYGEYKGMELEDGTCIGWIQMNTLQGNDCLIGIEESNL